MLDKEQALAIEENLAAIMYYRPNVTQPDKAELQERAVKAIRSILAGAAPDLFAERIRVQMIEWYLTDKGPHGGAWHSEEVPVEQVTGFLIGLVTRDDVLQVLRGKTYEVVKK